MYTKEIAFTNLKSVMTLVQDRLNKVTDGNKEGSKFVFDLCNTVFVKINYDLKFLNEENEGRMSKVHSELLSDIKFLLTQGSFNITKLLKGLD